MEKWREVVRFGASKDAVRGALEKLYGKEQVKAGFDADTIAVDAETLTCTGTKLFFSFDDAGNLYWVHLISESCMSDEYLRGAWVAMYGAPDDCAETRFWVNPHRACTWVVEEEGMAIELTESRGRLDGSGGYMTGLSVLYRPLSTTSFDLVDPERIYREEK